MPTIKFNLDWEPEVTQRIDAFYPDGFPLRTRPYYAAGDVLTDMDGNRWICMQPAKPSDGFCYSYFISFDKCITSRGQADFSQLPSLPLAKQMAFAVAFFGCSFNYYPITTYKTSYQLENMETYADYDFDEYYVRRDSMTYSEIINERGYKQTIVNDLEPNYVNVLYKGADGKPYILRFNLHIEFVTQLGERHSEFYTCYPGEPGHLMSIEDTYNQALVDQYATKDSCVFRQWVLWDKTGDHQAEVDAYNNKLNHTMYGDANAVSNLEERSKQRYYTVPTAGPRKKAAKNDDKQWLMTGMDKMNYRTATAGINMWNEPVMTFAVKRLKDEGKRCHQFEDGTEIAYANYISFDNALSTGENYGYFVYTQVNNTYWKDFFSTDGVPEPYLGMQEPIQ